MVPEFKSVSELVAFLKENELSKEDIIAALETISAHRSTGGQRRGQLAGLAVEDMTDEQLKRELINANSVLYKAKQRGASVETIEKNQNRVDAALAEKAKRHPQVEAPVVDSTTAPAEEVYNADVAAEL